MNSANFVKIERVRFDMSRIFRYWSDGLKIELDDGHMKWSLSFQSVTERDEALKILDQAVNLFPPCGEFQAQAKPPASITFSSGN